MAAASKVPSRAMRLTAKILKGGTRSNRCMYRENDRPVVGPRPGYFWANQSKARRGQWASHHGKVAGKREQGQHTIQRRS